MKKLPVRARPIGRLHRAGRFGLRHPFYVSILSLLLCAASASVLAMRGTERALSKEDLRKYQSAALKNANWRQKIVTQARSSHYLRAIEEADDLRTRRQPPSRYYDLASVYALARIRAELDPDLDEDSRQLRVDYCRASMYEMLEQARVGGYFRSPDCRKQIGVDVHFELMNDEPEFVSFVKRLKEEQT